MPLENFRGITPKIDDTCFVAASATLIGDVVLEKDASVWYGCVLRGDINAIRLGEESNLQDNSVVHVDDELPTTIGRQVTVGHNCVIHGCTIGDRCLIGMGAVILNRAVIGEGSIIAAGTVVAEGKVIPPGSLVMGVPGRIVREVSRSQLAATLENSAVYVALAREYREGGR